MKGSSPGFRKGKLRGGMPFFRVYEREKEQKSGKIKYKRLPECSSASPKSPQGEERKEGGRVEAGKERSDIERIRTLHKNLKRGLRNLGSAIITSTRKRKPRKGGGQKTTEPQQHRGTGKKKREAIDSKEPVGKTPTPK